MDEGRGGREGWVGRRGRRRRLGRWRCLSDDLEWRRGRSGVKVVGGCGGGEREAKRAESEGRSRGVGWDRATWWHSARGELVSDVFTESLELGGREWRAAILGRGGPSESRPSIAVFAREHAFAPQTASTFRYASVAHKRRPSIPGRPKYPGSCQSMRSQSEMAPRSCSHRRSTLVTLPRVPRGPPPE